MINRVTVNSPYAAIHMVIVTVDMAREGLLRESSVLSLLSTPALFLLSVPSPTSRRNCAAYGVEDLESGNAAIVYLLHKNIADTYIYIYIYDVYYIYIYIYLSRYIRTHTWMNLEIDDLLELVVGDKERGLHLREGLVVLLSANIPVNMGLTSPRTSTCEFHETHLRFETGPDSWNENNRRRHDTDSLCEAGNRTCACSRSGSSLLSTTRLK